MSINKFRVILLFWFMIGLSSAIFSSYVQAGNHEQLSSYFLNENQQNNDNLVYISFSILYSLLFIVSFIGLYRFRSWAIYLNILLLLIGMIPFFHLFVVKHFISYNLEILSFLLHGFIYGLIFFEPNISEHYAND